MVMTRRGQSEPWFSAKLRGTGKRGYQALSPSSASPHTWGPQASRSPYLRAIYPQPYLECPYDLRYFWKLWGLTDRLAAAPGV